MTTWLISFAGVFSICAAILTFLFSGIVDGKPKPTRMNPIADLFDLIISALNIVPRWGWLGMAVFFLILGAALNPECCTPGPYDGSPVTRW